MAFKLKPDKKESENKTIRFPVDLIDEINTAIAKKEVSFSGFVIQACQYALNELEDSDEDNSRIRKNSRYFYACYFILLNFSFLITVD